MSFALVAQITAWQLGMVNEKHRLNLERQEEMKISRGSCSLRVSTRSSAEAAPLKRL